MYLEMVSTSSPCTAAWCMSIMRCTICAQPASSERRVTITLAEWQDTQYTETWNWPSPCGRKMLQSRFGGTPGVGWSFGAVDCALCATAATGALAARTGRVAPPKSTTQAVAPSTPAAAAKRIVLGPIIFTLKLLPILIPLQQNSLCPSPTRNPWWSTREKSGSPKCAGKRTPPPLPSGRLTTGTFSAPCLRQ
jgi:hypothetical protein